MNKPRLIDANAFYTNYCNRFEKTVDDGELDRMAYALMHQPTAYDIDKIVEQLEALPNINQNYHSSTEMIDREDAIEIAKGGVNNG